MTEYGWGSASGGEIPAGAHAGGHGWEWVKASDPDAGLALAGGPQRDGWVRVPLWLARSVPSDGGDVLVCRVRPGYGAALYRRERSQRVDPYEVLLDEGTWVWPETDDHGVPQRPANAVVCGNRGGPVYAAIDVPAEDEPHIPYDYVEGEDNRCMMLVDPQLSATAADPSGYRWAPASDGEIPAGAPANGHGWRWRDTEDGGQEEEPQWVVRTPPGGSEVRVGWIERGGDAHVGPGRTVSSYEVLVDPGNWVGAEWNETDDGDCWQDIAGKGVPVGFTEDEAPLFATLRDREGEGYQPGEQPARADCRFGYRVLAAPVPAAAGPGPAVDEPATAAPQPSGPVAVISALDLKGEVVEISNAGDAPLDLGGWKLNDASKGKPYVFPAGTVVAAGASVRVRSGAGAATAGPGELKWKTTNVWNDRGDTAYLADPSDTIVATKKG